jgi:5-methylcytosine-specific restriction endonuclease McrA
MVRVVRRQVRHQSTRQRFLEKRALTRVPQGKEIDHKVPLWEGGSDSLRNLRLIKKRTHRAKTRAEAKRRADKR